MYLADDDVACLACLRLKSRLSACYGVSGGLYLFFLDQLATAGPEIGDPYAAPPQPRSYLAAIEKQPRKLRIAFTTKRFDGEACDPECKAATQAAATLCEKLGHHVEEGMPQVSGDDIGDARLIAASSLTMIIDS